MPAGPETLWGPGLLRGWAGAQAVGGSHTDFTNTLALSLLCLSSWKQGGRRASRELGARGQLGSEVEALGSARNWHQGPGPCSSARWRQHWGLGVLVLLCPGGAHCVF